MDVLLRDGEGDASDATLDVALDRGERLRRGLVQRVELILTPLQPTTHEPGLAPAGFEVVERRDGARRARLHDSQRPGRRSGHIARAGEQGAHRRTANVGQRFVEAGDGDGGTSQVGHAMLPAPRAHPPMRSFPRTGNAPHLGRAM